VRPASRDVSDRAPLRLIDALVRQRAEGAQHRRRVKI
jgi:hypothetical protein